MRYARRAIAILTVFATGFIAAATAAYAKGVPDPQVAKPVPTAPLVGDQWFNDPVSVHTTSAAGLPVWQLLTFVALAVLMAGAIVGLGYAISHSRRSHPSPTSQHPLPS
jgi:hypothetical protein